MEDQELMQKFQMFERQIMQTQEQIQAVEQGLLELGDLNSGLESIKGKEGEEILAPIGRGVFVKAKLLSEELTVDVGEKTFVKKTIESTQKVIDDQIGKLNSVKEEMENQLQAINQELTKTMLDHQKKKQSEECDCDPGQPCECNKEEPCHDEECGCKGH